MGILIRITANGDQLVLSQPNAQVVVPRSPMSGSNLPQVTYKNETQWGLKVTFATSPYAEVTFPISANPGEYEPTWLASVVAQGYPYTASEDDSEKGVDRGSSNVQPVNGDITITVQT
jgi:hypothetical protein